MDLPYAEGVEGTTADAESWSLSLVLPVAHRWLVHRPGERQQPHPQPLLDLVSAGGLALLLLVGGLQSVATGAAPDGMAWLQEPGFLESLQWFRAAPPKSPSDLSPGAGRLS